MAFALYVSWITYVKRCHLVKLSSEHCVCVCVCTCVCVGVTGMAFALYVSWITYVKRCHLVIMIVITFIKSL